MSRTIFALAFVCISFISTAQEKEYAKQVIDYLCSPELQGRGYVGDGNKKAAEYIAAEFQKNGLQPLTKDYFQYFSYPANSFPEKVGVTVNGEKLVPGKDYLIHESAPAIKGKFQTITLTNAQLLDGKSLGQKLKSANGKFIALTPNNSKDFTKEEQKTINQIRQALFLQQDLNIAGVVELVETKLTWSAAPFVAPRPQITILTNAFQSEIKELKLDIENTFLESFQTQNVIGKIPGKRSDSTLFVTAHYDHLGMMGPALFPGANDNASGVAMMLCLAKYFSQHPPKFDMVFIAFSGEEIGLKGSAFYVEHPLIPLNQIRFMYNLDLSGTGDDGIQVVNGTIHKAQFDRLKNLNDSLSLLKEVKIRGEACNSDHCFFHQQGVPVFYSYTLGGITAYHDTDDRADLLPLTAFDEYFTLLHLFLEGF